MHYYDMFIDQMKIACRCTVDLVFRLRHFFFFSRQDLEPDVTFVDGNGRLHPRGAGLACHLGVVTGLRTVGLGKTFLHVDGLTKTGVREVNQAGPSSSVQQRPSGT